MTLDSSEAEIIAPGESSQADRTAVQCRYRRCGRPALRGRLGAFCSNTHKVHVLRHPEDDTRKEHYALRRKGDPGTGRLKPTALLALGRLQKGPATGLDLFRAGAGMRYGARLLELKRAGHQISKRLIGHDPEVWLYTLEVEPPPGRED